MSGRTSSAVRRIGHVQPLVRAQPETSAHPAAEAWRRERFARLQQRLATATAARPGGNRRFMVLLPSRSVDRWHEPSAETRSYEERLLSYVLDLRDPALELTYVTSLPVAQRTIDYYLSLLPSRIRRSARRRLRLVSLGDDGQRPLSEKLLERPRVLEQIRRTLLDPNVAYLLPYNSTALERDIALELDIPLFGADPGHAWLGTKSGSRALFAKAGVPHPLGSGQIRTIRDAVDAICALRAVKPELAQVVIKLDHAVSGEGNAIVDLAGLPETRRMRRGRADSAAPRALGLRRGWRQPSGLPAQARRAGRSRGRAHHRAGAAKPKRPARDHARRRGLDAVQQACGIHGIRAKVNSCTTNHGSLGGLASVRRWLQAACCSRRAAAVRSTAARASRQGGRAAPRAPR